MGKKYSLFDAQLEAELWDGIVIHYWMCYGHMKRESIWNLRVSGVLVQLNSLCLLFTRSFPELPIQIVH